MDFVVRSFPYESSEVWPILFSNGDIFGRIRIGQCLTAAGVCGGPLRMEIESNSGELLTEGFGVQVLRPSESNGVLGRSFIGGSALLESANLLLTDHEWTVRAYDDDSLELRWETNLGFVNILAVSGGESPRILLRARSTQAEPTLIALNLDGSEAWRREGFGGGLFADADYVVLSGDGDSEKDVSFVAINADDGEDRWRVENRPRGQAFEVDGYVFWAGAGRLERVEPTTGETIWKVRRGGIDSLTIEGDSVDFGDAGSFDLATGQRRLAPGRTPAG